MESNTWMVQVLLESKDATLQAGLASKNSENIPTSMCACCNTMSEPGNGDNLDTLCQQCEYVVSQTMSDFGVTKELAIEMCMALEN